MKKKNLFVAETPNQLINASVLASSMNDEICEICCTANIERLIPKLQKSSFFSKVYSVDLQNKVGKTESKIVRIVLQLKNILSLSEIKKFEFVENANTYKRVFISGENFRVFEIFYMMKRKNPTLALSIYEEGLCEYFEFGKNELNGKDRISRLLFGSYFKQDCDSFYVYAPKLAQNIWDNVEAKEIPKSAFTKTLLNELYSIFDYQKGVIESDKKRIVFIESAFLPGSMREKQQEVIIQDAKMHAGDTELVIKLHPRSADNKFGEGFSYLRTRVPMEIIALNENLQNVLFITIGSSAAFNLFMECNARTKVIILDDILDGNCGELFKNAAKATKTGKLEIPQTMDEYRQLVKAFQEEK